MSKTTQTRFQNVNSGDKIVLYEKDFVIIRKVSSEDKIEDEVYLDNDQIKRINKIINKNAREEYK